MKRIEKHIIINNKQMDHLCYLSKNLYNYANFCIRRRFIKSGRFISGYKLIKIFTKINQYDYRQLHAWTAQSIILQLEKNWKLFFKQIKDYKKNPQKYKGRPKFPKYKKKNGRNLIIFNKRKYSIKGNYFHFPKSADLQPIKTNVENIKQIRIIPRSKHHIIEVVYEKEVKQNENLKENLYLSIDSGINNLATCIDNTDNSFIINGKIVKSINQYFNKKKAQLQSYLILNENKFISNKLSKLGLKRENKINDYFHKTSKFIINYCIKNNIKNIIIGYNKNWKQNINIGKINNQKFVSIPYNKLIQMIQYKSEEVGIDIILQEESYTSKCDSLALEIIKKKNFYLGKRIKRGLFQSSVGKLINADVNGAINILRKVINDSEMIVDRGLVHNPIRFNCV